jgi:hypothetical protein
MKTKAAKTRPGQKKRQSLRKVVRDLAPGGDVKGGNAGCPTCSILGRTNSNPPSEK